MNNVNLVFQELRDAWAVAIAQVTAVATYAVGAPLWLAAACAGTVLGVRVAAGLRWPLPPHIPPMKTLSAPEARIANLTVDGLNAEEIARAVGSNATSIRKVRRSIYARLGLRYPSELREWLIEVGWRRDDRWQQWVKGLIESTPVRATLTAGGFIGMCWTLYQIWKTALCPAFLPTCT